MSTIGNFNIMDWIESGTVARRTVVIYNNPALAAEFEDLERRMVAAERDPSPDRTLGERSEAQRIEAEMADLHERWEASKAVWTVQALSDEKLREIDRTHPLPTPPKGATDDADEAAKVAHQAEFEAWMKERAVAADERNFALISASVVSVETSQGTASSVPVEALRAMRKRPHGAIQTERLIQAVKEATAGDVEIPAPKLRRPSESDRG